MVIQGLLYLLILSTLQTSVISNKHKLGGIFEYGERKEANLFRLTGTVTDVEIKVENIEKLNLLSASQALCKMKKEGISGVFVPPSDSLSQHIASGCHALNIPLVTDLVNVYLQPQILNEFYMDLVKILKWDRFILLYEESSQLVHLSQLLKTFSDISVRQLDSNHNHRAMLQEIQAAGARNILLDCTTGTLTEVLHQAQQVGLMTPSQSYIITSMDLHTINLEPYQYAGTNIFGLNAIEPESESLKSLKMENTNVNVSSALVYDSVLVYAHVLHQLNLTFSPQECELEPESEYNHISSIADYIENNVVSVRGITGWIHLDKQGNRTNMALQVMQLQENGLETIGKWNSGNKLKLRIPNPPKRFKSALPGTHLKVLTILSTPYVMRKHSDKPLEGISQFEGYAVDILEEISQILGFTYEFKLNYDYGSLDPQTNRWTGMLHQLQAGRADMVVADLTITTERYSAFDFTMPFINTGISTLYYKPSPHLGVSLLTIFSAKLWFYLALCFVIMAVMFFLLARLSPFHRHSVKKTEQFTFSNSLWFAFASMRPLGCGVEPRSLSTRFLALVWWHFIALIVATYVGGLVALLLSDSAAELPFKNVYDLAQQTDIKYGAVRRGATLNFFKESSEPMFQQMYTEMVKSPDVLMPYTEAGIERVKTEQGGYAFLTDALAIEYAVMCDTDLIQIGGQLDYKGYGIALPRGSPYRKALNSALLNIKESGRLFALKVKWWHRPCHKSPAKRQAIELEFSNLSSGFLILFIVCVLGILTAIIENKQRKASMNKNPKINITKPTPEAIRRSNHHR